MHYLIMLMCCVSMHIILHHFEKIYIANLTTFYNEHAHVTMGIMRAMQAHGNEVMCINGTARSYIQKLAFRCTSISLTLTLTPALKQQLGLFGARG